MAINLDIIATVKGLQNLQKVEKTMQRLSKDAKRGFAGATAQIRKMNGSLAENNKFLSRSADRVGFMAFQFTFLEGIAQRVLGNIKRFMQEVITEGAEGIEGMTRAVAQSGIDFSGQTEDSAEAVKFLNDALLDLGGGKTIFNIQEVSEAMREIGKATDLTGTEMQKSNKLIGVTKQVLRLMTIEQVQSDEAAKSLIKTMNNFGLSLNEAARVTDVLINVNQSSAITLDELTRSFGFASSQAVEFGLSVEETGALLGVLGNRLGQGAGAAGRNFRQLLVGLKNNALNTSEALDFMGVSILDNNKNIKPFIQFLDEVRGAMDEAGQSSDAFKIFLQKQMGLEVRAADALAKLTQATKEEIEAAVEAAKTGDSAALEKLFGSTPQANIKKMNNAIGTLKVLFVGGLAPAITQVTEVVNELVRDTGLQEMAVELGTILGQKLIPIVKVLAKELKRLTQFFREHKTILDFLINGFIVFIGLMVSLLIIASVGKVVAAFTSLLLKLSLVMGPGGAATATSGFTAGLRAMVVPMLAIIAVFAGIIIAALAFKNLITVLTDDVPNDMQEMEIATSASLVAIGVAMAALIGGPAGLAAALVALAAVAVITWADHIGALDAFQDKWDETMQIIEDEDLEGLDALLITFKAWTESMEAAGEVMGENIGTNMTQWVLDFQDDLSNTDFGEMWAAFAEGNLDGAMTAAQKIAASLVASFFGFIVGAEGLEKMTGKAITDLPTGVAEEAAIAGALLGDKLRQAFIDGFTKNLGESLLNALSTALGPVLGPMITGIIRGIGKGVNDTALRAGVNEAPDPESRFDGSPGINVDGDNFQPAPVNGTGEIVPNNFVQQLINDNPFAGLIEWSDETLTDAEPLKESIIILGEETLPMMQETFEISTADMTKLDESTNLLNASTNLQTSSTEDLTKTTDINTNAVKVLTAKERLLQTIVDEATLQLALETNQIVRLQLSTNNAALAMQKMAVEGTEAARRLSTLRVSTSGKFSMSGRQTTTSFSNIPSLQSEFADIIATQIGEAINIGALNQAQAATVDVGGINITIEGNADEEVVDRLVAEFQDKLNKEIGNKNTVLVGRT
jgi:TP901 family phage tail tape measure protein